MNEVETRVELITLMHESLNIDEYSLQELINDGTGAK